MSDPKERISKELDRIREGVRERALEPQTLPKAKEPHRPQETPKEEPPPPEPPPPRPDGREVNELWRSEPKTRVGGLRGFLGRVLGWIFSDKSDAQRAFNAKQVQLDNEILAYIDSKSDHTHRHYDRILGLYGRHLGEADERHLILQEELVAHVHDLVKRIDLVLSEVERGRMSLEFQLRELRERLQKLEGRPKRE